VIDTSFTNWGAVTKRGDVEHRRERTSNKKIRKMKREKRIVGMRPSHRRGQRGRKRVSGGRWEPLKATGEIEVGDQAPSIGEGAEYRKETYD